MMISSVSTSQIASSLFSKLDTKSQGYIEKTDLESAFSSISSDSSSNVDDLFSALDSDSDGKVTKDEMTSGIDNLLSGLNSQFDSMRMQGGMGGSGGPQGMPPPPPPQGGEGTEDTGLTKDEVTSIASSTDDSKLSSLMTDISENFEAADTNEDGKVSMQEAMAYKESSDKANGSSTDSTESTSTSSSNSAMSQITRQIQQLISAYGLNESTSSSLSYSA
ncbi:EF-hand domain-containing protein [Methylovorus menthalis]|uniref:EF-hand domain-containing protein n=1 Tax=Methylovorus menthalis TaxID=1002227 RepID=UPI001E563673|nr:EF-hand domain-containing protein [Methylovorus menthalis]MCB4811875.1 EF-hand domain-containing protein [Methylovorus menthalis]